MFRLCPSVTCFTFCSVKTWCTTAVESVHSVCTGPVVLTGMTCAVVNICFKGKDEMENYLMIYVTYERTCRISNFTCILHIKAAYYSIQFNSKLNEKNRMISY